MKRFEREIRFIEPDLPGEIAAALAAVALDLFLLEDRYGLPVAADLCAEAVVAAYKSAQERYPEPLEHVANLAEDILLRKLPLDEMDMGHPKTVIWLRTEDNGVRKRVSVVLRGKLVEEQIPSNWDDVWFIPSECGITSVVDSLWRVYDINPLWEIDRPQWITATDDVSVKDFWVLLAKRGITSCVSLE